MSERLNKKIRQLLRRQEKKMIDEEIKVIPYLFKPRPKIIPKFLWKLLFYIIVKKEMLNYLE